MPAAITPMYCAEFDEASHTAYRLLQEEKEKRNFLFVTMGAGDNWKVGKKLLAMLNSNANEDS